MKKILVLCIAICMAAHTSAQNYNFGLGVPIHKEGPAKSPFAAAMMSVIMPGLGQFYVGDYASGMFFMVCGPILSGGLIVFGEVFAKPVYTYDRYGQMSSGRSDALLYVGIGLYLANWIGSIVQAPIVANRVNAARGYAGKFDISPSFRRYAYANQTISTTGLTFSVRF